MKKDLVKKNTRKNNKNKKQIQTKSRKNRHMNGGRPKVSFPYTYFILYYDNFIKYNKYRTKENLFYTNEKDSLNRIQVKSKLNYKYYSLLLKSKFCEVLNKYTHIIPLRGEKKYQHFLEFKLLKEPFFNKEFNVNDLLDYLLTFIILRKFLQK